MDPANTGNQSFQSNWSQLLSQAAIGSASLFIKGEGRQASYVAISPLDKTIDTDYKKLSIKEIVQISKSSLIQDSTQLEENIRIKSQVTALIEIESTKLKERVGAIKDLKAQKTIEKLDQSKNLFRLNQDETEFLQALKSTGLKTQKV